MRAKTYNVRELVLCLPEKKKDKLKPKWEGPFIIDEVLTGGAHTAALYARAASLAVSKLPRPRRIPRNRISAEKPPEGRTACVMRQTII